MTMLTAPAGTLTDGVVELRLPSLDAGDIETINQYVEDEQLDGGWLPDIPLVSAPTGGCGLAGRMGWAS